MREDIFNLSKVCLNQNYCEFDGKIYVGKEGLAMGNPLSPLASEIFMDYLETKIRAHPYFKLFMFWYRYVDDVLAIFLGTRRQLQNFLNFINDLHRNITFTIEIEVNDSINFLDLSITKQNNKLNISIFHKPTHMDMVIHNTSAHPYSHKLAAFHSYIHRLISCLLYTSRCV